MFALRRVPKIGDVFNRGGYRFEVVDMDANRVDRVLISRSPFRVTESVSPPAQD